MEVSVLGIENPAPIIGAVNQCPGFGRSHPAGAFIAMGAPAVQELLQPRFVTGLHGGVHIARSIAASDIVGLDSAMDEPLALFRHVPKAFGVLLADQFRKCVKGFNESGNDLAAIPARCPPADFLRFEYSDIDAALGSSPRTAVSHSRLRRWMVVTMAAPRFVRVSAATRPSLASRARTTSPCSTSRCTSRTMPECE